MLVRGEQSLVLGFCMLWFCAACSPIEEVSSLDVAGESTVDDIHSQPNTVWVSVRAEGLHDDYAIESVGTFVSFRGERVLVMSLADSFIEKQIFEVNLGELVRRAVLPPITRIHLKVAESNRGNWKIDTKMSFDGSGRLDKGRGAKLLAVGTRFAKINEIPSEFRRMGIDEVAIQKFEKEIFYQENDIQEFRNAITSFLLLKLPTSYGLPSRTGAEFNPFSRTQLTVTGFGGTMGDREESRKNSAAATVADDTTLARVLRSRSNVAKQIWEIKGAGVCTSQPTLGRRHKSYDTGSTVYDSSGSFVGFAVRSEDHQSRRPFDCDSGKIADVRTLVVSPQEDHFNALFR